ncbi:MAG TPA: hypothetical protein VH592_13465 [Gemmataceae bacterium]|jgi:hypothetical protein
MSGGWQQRVGHAPGTQQLRQAQFVAQRLADPSGSILPTKARVVFQTVSDAALLGAVLVSGALAAVHLWRVLAPKPKERHTPDPAGGGRVPPRRPASHTAAAGDGNAGRSYEEDAARSR